MKNLRIILLLLVVVSGVQAQDQKPAFWNDIQNFKHQDSIQSPPQHAILFVGSSSFTKWTDVQNYFPGYTIVNRGFGGSSLPDVIRYAGQIIFPYHPRQIVIYCGENDLAGSDTITAETVYERFAVLFDLIRKRLPDVPVIFISLKPSPSRWKLHEKMTNANDKIKDFLSKQKRTVFIDVYHKMLGQDGLPMPDIFIDDKLHMNAKGYAIWQKEIEPHLLK